MRERLARVTVIEPAGSRAVVIGLEPIDPPAVAWRAGQFVSLRIDERGARRSFSIVTPPGTGALELLVGVGGTGGTARFLAALEVGAEVRYFGPMGYFVAPDHGGERIAGVTGVGISAVLPMLGDGWTLYWSVRDRSEAALLERVEAIPGVALHLHVTGEGDPRLTGALVAAAAAARDPLVALCGNPAMIAGVIAGLAARGVDARTRVITELFYPPSAPLQL